MDALLTGLGLGLGSGLAPGPLLVLALAVTLRFGRGPGLQVAIAPLLSDFLIIAISLSVLSQMPSNVITWLGVTGGIVIVFSAWETWRSARTTSPNALLDKAHAPGIPNRRPPWLQGFLVNLLNPAPWVFWTTAGSALVINQWTASPSRAVVFLLAFYLGLVGSKVAMVLLLAAGRHRLSITAYRYILFGASLALLIIGIGFLVRNVTTLLA